MIPPITSVGLCRHLTQGHLAETPNSMECVTDASKHLLGLSVTLHNDDVKRHGLNFMSRELIYTFL